MKNARDKLVWTLLLLACGWMAADAWARCAATGHAQDLAVSITLPPELAADFARRVRTGVTVKVVHTVHVEVADSPSEDLLTFGCEVLYDPWDEIYDIVPLAGAAAARSPHERQPGDHNRVLSELPAFCRVGHFVVQSTPGEPVHVLTQLDPVSEEQVQTTRRWLAERGIGAAGPSLLGRAVAALIDLKGGRSADSACTVTNDSKAP